jgi:hypothetical protein
VTNAPPRLKTTRRGFLAWAGSGAALASVARMPLAAGASAGAPASGRFFSETQREILTQVVERMVDTGEPDAPPVRATRAIDVIDGLVAGLDPELSAPLPTLLRAVEWGPLLFDRRLSRFTRLAPEAQDASLRGWMTSRLALRRQGFEALRNLAFMGYWSQEETWGLIGYAGRLLQGGEARG